MCPPEVDVVWWYVLSVCCCRLFGRFVFCLSWACVLNERQRLRHTISCCMISSSFFFSFFLSIFFFLCFLDRCPYFSLFFITCVFSVGAHTQTQNKRTQTQSEALLTEALIVYQNGLPPDHPEIADCMDKVRSDPMIDWAGLFSIVHVVLEEIAWCLCVCVSLF